MSHEIAPTAFTLYRWKNPSTTSDYPFLAVAEDRSAFLAIGNYGVGFDWRVPEEAEPWLAQDFEPTGESLLVDLAPVREVLDATFRGGVKFGFVAFGPDLGPTGLQLSLATQLNAEGGAEFIVEGFGSYQRLFRDPDEMEPVMPSERAMLDVCVSSFAQLAGTCIAQLTAPPPPRFRPVSSLVN